MCLIDNVEVKKQFSQDCTVIVSKMCKIFINFSENVDAEAEKARITSQIEKINFEIERSTKMLQNQNFVAKAPKKLVDAETEKLQKNRQILLDLQNELKKYWCDRRKYEHIWRT